MSTTLHPTVLSQMLIKPVFIATFALLGILGGVVPQLTPTSSAHRLSFDTRAVAQAFSADEIASYAKAALAIERLRQPAFSEIKQMLGANTMPVVLCNQSDSANRLPTDARRIFIEYCQEAKNIVETNGLSSGRFNEIRTMLRSNPDLQQKVKAELVRLQR
jgi:hypothetical protein